MDLYRIVAVFIIIVLTVLILYHLIQRRKGLLSKTEGFTNNGKNPVSIKSINSARANLPLMSYCIKASYNSAYDGKNISLAAIDSVLSRGVRLLDLEIYNINNQAVVSYSIDPAFSSITSGNFLPLTKVLDEIVGNCFTGNCPNSRDPLFLQLRVKSNCGISESSSCEIYNQVASALKTSIGNSLYTENGKAIHISGSTNLSDLASKVIVVFDQSMGTNMEQYMSCDTSATENCISLSDYINIYSGTSEWKKYKFGDFINMATNPLAISSDTMSAEPSQGTLTLKMAVPDVGINVNNSAFPLSNIVDFGVQTALMKFYQSGQALNAYEKMFDHFNTAFIPLGFVVQYVNTGKD